MRRSIAALAFTATLSISADAADTLPINPEVTPENIHATICVKGWSARVRPPQVYTDRVKKHLMREAGIPLDMIHDYVLDHIIPISSGGSPTALSNLRLQRREESLEKDRAENRSHQFECDGRMSLHDAQHTIYADWRKLLPIR